MKKVKWVKQSTLYTCGPACISMVSGVPESKIVDMLQGRLNKRGLKINHVYWCLNKLGILCSKPQSNDLWTLSKKCIIRLGSFFHMNYRYVDHGHVLVYYNKKFYDPYYGIRNNLFHDSLSNSWIKVTDYIDIYD